jgi:DNA-binding LacI/PurR family transcriptional regulator
MATIKQVAELAAVSTATVSYVLNGTGKVSAETRRRVQEAMTRLNYQPSHAARSLRGHSHTLGLVLAEQGRLSDPALAELLAGVADAAAERGYYLLIATPGASDDEIGQELQLARSGRVDGLLLLDPRESDERVERLGGQSIPHVWIGPAPAESGSPSVIVASQAGAVQAVNYLYGLGHRRIALIQLPSELTESEPRYLGYIEALAAAGIEADPTLIVEGGRGQEDGYQAMQELMSLLEPPTAVLASSDELAFGAMHLLHDDGLEVGRDVSVVGFDDVPLAAHTHPPLTTLRQPRHTIGMRAAELLIGLIERRSGARQLTLEAQLIVRRSCGSPRATA